jgi:hypothetical protein
MHDSTAATAAPTPTKTPVTVLGAGLLPLPPDVAIPSPPQGYEPTTGINFRGFVPWTAELVILPKVLKDLARFTSYSGVLGNTAPPIAQLIEALTWTRGWRRASTARRNRRCSRPCSRTASGRLGAGVRRKLRCK